ncbi:MAG: hypothetical protein HOP08_14775 [Cyclobacteriaceae bacterium]|nr:hypothetical protein [Cyclobacteriaceae bacterium]
MKNVSIVVFVILIALMAQSCSKENQVTPASQNTLGQVVPASSTNSTVSDNLLLLKDGRMAKPVSGIPNFNKMPVGNTLSLSFTTGTDNNGVIDIHVTKFETALDSVFVLKPANLDADTDPDTATFKLRGVYAGVVSYMADSTDVSSIVNKNTSISFSSPNNYSCTGVTNGYPASGSGTFVSSHGTFVWMGVISFTNSNTNSSSVLNGSFRYFVTNTDLLCLYATRNGISYSFYLRK